MEFAKILDCLHRPKTRSKALILVSNKVLVRKSKLHPICYCLLPDFKSRGHPRPMTIGNFARLLIGAIKLQGNTLKLTFGSEISSIHDF